MKALRHRFEHEIKDFDVAQKQVMDALSKLVKRHFIKEYKNHSLTK